ncbi:MAG: antibiotic biosynthesis monooxygenase [Nocardiopsaceae bacterium]|jgi:quinol monooxygenase YgiN|nr:antibiotic biosynthesis monooxygenase [Nocardiopsaceae bacterium]
MSITFVAAVIATLAAAAGTAGVVRRCIQLPRLDLLAWACALTGLTLGLVAQALGFSSGFGPGSFRAVQLGAQWLGPLALLWGLAELTGRSLGARFAGRLLIGGLGVVTGVIMATDPLSAARFTTAWPAASLHYQLIPNGVLLLLAVVIVVTSAAAVIVAWTRSRAEPAWRRAVPVTAAAGGAAVLTDLLRLSLPANVAYAVVCLLAAAGAWFAGTRGSELSLETLQARAGDEDYRRYEDTGYGQRYGDPGYGGYQDQGRYGYGAGDYSSGYPGGDRYDEVNNDTDYGFYRTDTDFGRAISDSGGFRWEDTDAGRALAEAGPGSYGDDGLDGAPGDGFGDLAPAAAGLGEAADAMLPAVAGLGGDGGEGTERLFGQIAIYTLLEGRTDEFDQLARQIVEKVRSSEPGTLVYVMHGVPSAPMQRILYEVYQDQDAFNEHAQQSYIRNFEEQSKPYVLATNVIELGVRQAKVSPLTPAPPAANGSGVRRGPAPGRGPDPARPPVPDGHRGSDGHRGPDGYPALSEYPATAAYPARGSRSGSPRSGSPRPAPPRPAPPPPAPPRPAPSRQAAPRPSPPGENDGGFWSRSAPPPPPAGENDDRDFWSRGSGQ